MPTFTVLCRIDAFANFVAQVEADNAEEAASLAYDSPEDYKWEDDGVDKFQARQYVTLNEDGEEIEGTEQGRL